MNKTLWLASVSTFLLGLIGGFGVGPWIHNKIREVQFTPVMKIENQAARLLLSNDKGGCTGKAKQARHEPLNGSGEAHWGCWIPILAVGMVQVAFTDGEGAIVPMAMFEPIDNP